MAVWGWWVYGTEETRHGVATNETKTNYVQAVNYQTFEHRLRRGRDGKQKQRMNNLNTLNAGKKISGTSSGSHTNTYGFFNIICKLKSQTLNTSKVWLYTPPAEIRA